MDMVAAFSLVFDSEGGDLRIVLKSEDDGETQATFAVISQILTARSPVFAAMFAHDMKEAATHEVVMQGFSREAVAAFLRYLYTDRLEVPAPFLVEVVALADKYQVQPLIQVASEALTKNLTPDNAFEVLCVAKRMGAPSVAERTMQYIYTNALDALPAAFVLGPEDLGQVLSCPKLCITDFNLATILLAWKDKPAAKHHNVRALLAKHVQLSAVNDDSYSKLEALADDVGLKECVKNLRSVAKRGTHTEDVFKELYTIFIEKFPLQATRPLFLGYWMNVIPSRASLYPQNVGSSAELVILSAVRLQTYGYNQPHILEKDDVLRWFLPHHTLFIHSLSFALVGSADTSVPGLPELAVSADGVTWNVIFDAENYEEVKGNKVFPCHSEQGIQWFRLRVRAANFSAWPRFGGILVTS